MKKILTLTLAALCFCSMAYSQYSYNFTVVKENPATSVKNQSRTGTCWCFSTNSFIESELLRMGKGEFDLSEMFIVRENYSKRIDDNYIRKGKGNISEGSLSHMYINVMAEKGLIPEEAYSGINYDSETHHHTALSKYVKINSELAIEQKKRMPEELKNGILDAFLGKVPETFMYKGKEYTPVSFYKSLGLNASDYVEITSFTHHPFYKQVPFEVPDNWDHALYYNVPLDELMEIIDYAINNGYTIAWDGDVSEKGYNFTHHIALNTAEDLKSAKTIEKRYEEMPVTQESRQEGFENFTTTDDHLEHITGIAKDQEGVKYYKTKNSWGTERNGTGYHYMSENYIKAKTTAIMVHKNSIPKAIRAKLGIK